MNAKSYADCDTYNEIQEFFLDTVNTPAANYPSSLDPFAGDSSDDDTDEEPGAMSGLKTGGRGPGRGRGQGGRGNPKKCSTTRKSQPLRKATLAHTSQVLSGRDMCDNDQDLTDLNVWETINQRVVPPLNPHTNACLSLVVAGFQNYDEWDAWIPALLDLQEVQDNDLYEKEDLLSAAQRCHRGDGLLRVQVFRNMIFQIMLAAKVQEYVAFYSA